MKKFEFTLATPLRVKKSREREAEGELGTAARRELEFRAARDGLTGRYQAASDSLSRQLESGGVSLTDLKVHSMGFMTLRRRIADADKKVEAAESEVIRLTQKLKELTRERRALEEARERQYELWRGETERDQMRQIDDYVSARRVMAARSGRPGDIPGTGW